MLNPAVKHALKKDESVRDLKRDANDAKMEAVQLSNRLQEVQHELHRSEQKVICHVVCLYYECKF